jgi:polyhydroxyalkanoate synthase
MPASTTSRPDPFEDWSAFLREATQGQPTAGAGGPGEAQDRWSDLIDRLWEANPYSKVMPLDPGEVARAFQQIWLDAARNPTRAWRQYADFVQGYTQIAAAATLKAWSDGAQAEPVVQPEAADRRFEGADWERSAVFDAIKQTYLLTATTLLRSAAEIEGLDRRQQRKLVFYLRQFLDAISPTNFAFTNPQVIHEAISSGGRSLTRGLQNLQRDLAAGQLKMTDTDAFAPGRNLAVTPGKVVYRNTLIELIQYTPTTKTVHAIPLVFVPPWINKFYILDLRPENSLVKFMLEQGFTVFVVSWKNPDASLEDTTFEDYLDLGPLAALKVAQEISGSDTVNMVGYCVGGTPGPASSS